MWTPLTLGSLQNQAYGYLFPHGTFFLAADALRVPDWVAQRLWSGLLLVVAYEGARRLGRALGLPWGATVLGGLAYALSPRFLGGVGVLSGEAPPVALLPWVVLPLVLALTARLSARRGGLLSGVAVLCMGGVNAVGTLAVLPLAFLVAASGLRRCGGAGLVGWWSLGAALACAWWIGPLLLLGRYSPPFLDYIETAGATTNPTGWANGLRGAEHWVAYHTVAGQGWWPGAHTLVTSAPLALLGMGVAAFGLVGLLHERMPLRLPLTLALVVGLLCLTVGNPSMAGSLVDDPVRALLDGPLAPLRNVHKVDPLIRLPLALGVAHAAALLFRNSRLILERRGWASHQAVGRRVVGGALATVLLVGAAPLFTNGLRMPGWTDVPEAWTQTAAYLEARPDSRALVVPGAGFGVQTWGWTVDEPIQGLTDTAWVTRSQVLMVPGPTARMLDVVESRLADGHGSAGFADFLARAGITHVVLRRDLDQRAVETSDTDRAERALLDSPGLRRVTGFGATGFLGQALVDVYAVTGGAPRAAVVDSADLVTLDGGPEDLLAALDAGVVAPTQPVLVRSSDEPADLVTDGYRKVERQFGRIHDAVSGVMTASAAYRDGRVSADYPGPPTVSRAEADFLAIDDVSASTAQAYPDVLGPVLPAYGPAAAFDGQAATSWRSAALDRPEGQWLQVDLDEPVSGGVLQVTFLDEAGTATVREAAVAFDDVTGVYAVPDGRRLLVTLPSTPVHDIRITVAAVAPGDGATSPVAIAEVKLPQTPAGRTLDVPRPVGADSTVVLTEEAPRRACVDVGYGPHCEVSEIRASEWSGLDRRLTLTEDGAWDLSGTVVAEPGPAAAALLGPIGDAAVAAAGSVFGGDPSVSGAFAFDGDDRTPWLADPADGEATLTLGWSGTRTVSRIAVDRALVPAAEPVRARIESSEGVREVDLSGFGYFDPLPAPNGLSITFSRADLDAGVPLGIGDLRVEGLDGLQHSPEPAAATGAICGLGPEVQIDGTAYRTEVTGTVGDVMAGRPLTWRVCDGPVELSAGVHRLVADATVQFKPVSLTWTPLGASAAVRDGESSDGEAGTRLGVTAWSDARRVMSVAGGPEAILRIAENTNPGWRATADGEPLESVVLDGWQQGYRIPAGGPTEVVLEFTPDRAYRTSLLVGLVLALVLLAAAVIGPWRLRDRAHGASVDLGWRGRSLHVGTAAVLGLGGLVLGGIPLVAGWVLGLLAPARRYATAAGAVTVVAGGVLTAFSPGLAGGNPGTWADAMVAMGLGLLLAPLVEVRGSFVRRRLRRAA